MRFATATRGAVKAVQHAHGKVAWAPDPCVAAARSNRTAAGGRSQAANCQRDPWRPGHQLFLLRLFLECYAYPALLVLGAGARLAPDGLALFAGTQWLLGSDPSIWCVAGAAAAATQVVPTLASGPGASSRLLTLLRTDAVPPPEAGRLLTRPAGQVLLAQWRAAAAAAAAKGASSAGAPWPRADPRSGTAWHEFLQYRAVQRARQCVVPEVPRVLMLPPAGDSGTQSPTWGRAGVAWTDADLSHLMEPGYSKAVAQVMKRRCICWRM